MFFFLICHLCPYLCSLVKCNFSEYPHFPYVSLSPYLIGMFSPISHTSLMRFFLLSLTLSFCNPRSKVPEPPSPEMVGHEENGEGTMAEEFEWWNTCTSRATQVGISVALWWGGPSQETRRHNSGGVAQPRYPVVSTTSCSLSISSPCNSLSKSCLVHLSPRSHCPAIPAHLVAHVLHACLEEVVLSRYSAITD